jgi:RNA polymerase sigma-70 factor (ECF subfamily)
LCARISQFRNRIGVAPLMPGLVGCQSVGIGFTLRGQFAAPVSPVHGMNPPMAASASGDGVGARADPIADPRMTSPSPAPNRDALQRTLRRAAQGDELAWRDIIDTYTPRVFGLIRAQCNDPDLAEEITQSSFCTIVAKIDSYAELGKFEPWLFRIAMNRLRDEMRRRKRQARAVDDQTLVGLAGAADVADPSTVESVELQRLRTAIGQLSDADQRIIHLRHYGELSFKQIAEILEQPLGTVLARQHRALKKLAEILGEEAGNE